MHQFKICFYIYLSRGDGDTGRGADWDGRAPAQTVKHLMPRSYLSFIEKLHQNHVPVERLSPREGLTWLPETDQVPD